MDPQQCNNGSSRSSFLCRQSSSRWIPTADQIRILRDLYYNNGVRSPSAEQIQRISARLRQYGKIEGKNVFYWFQNHKARERQKKKLNMEMSSNITNNNDNTCTVDNKLNTTSINVPYGISSNSHGLYDVGNGYGGGPVFMERSIRESCMSGGGDGSIVDNSNMGWMEIEPAMPWMYHYIKEEEPATRDIETLPLFPTHSKQQEEDQDQEEEEEEEEEKYYCNNDYCTQPNGYLQENYQHHYTGNGAASLELTLNSCYSGSM